jgi:2C-methyl-D-erythritol 2,4-cyclodiphosphate synthase
MSEEDLKAVLAKYQQKAFELYNQNIVLETQVEKLNLTISTLSAELEKLRKPKRGTKVEEEFS